MSRFGRNHETFVIRRIDVASRPDLAARFGVEHGPALIVVEERTLRARLQRPTSSKAIAELLDPWLR